MGEIWHNVMQIVDSVVFRKCYSSRPNHISNLNHEVNLAGVSLSHGTVDSVFSTIMQCSMQAKLM